MAELCGIYKITCKPTGQIYIGYSRDIKERFKQHKRYLVKNSHYNGKLQYLWRCFGEHEFSFEILELCKFENLKNREDYYFNMLNPYINIADTSNGYSEKYLNRMKIRNKRIAKKLSLLNLDK
jgi:group I intron endonuclease